MCNTASAAPILHTRARRAGDSDAAGDSVRSVSTSLNPRARLPEVRARGLSDDLVG